ncbi:AAA family ATPase [Curtanaerobium respiraculi]|uniref:AAA family ATPase n=1 Tax=Curtanaerobium respiraculi TaxID=2949669 RepID=UPI0024B3592A|nr:P-loop NTPase [Curtanaerobium respiraculi]
MEQAAVLCVDSVAAQHPEILGLDGENLGAHAWLDVICDAARARAAASATGAAHLWVAGSDTVDAINLAAAVAHDGCDRVSLVVSQGSGSLYSRAKAAGISRVLDRGAFAKEYARVKQSAAATPAGSASPATAVLAPVRAGAPKHAPAAWSHLQHEDPPVEEAPAILFPPCPAVSSSGGPPSKGFVLSVVGAAGGVGKSTIAVATAYAAVASGRRTVILDADLQCGDIHYLMGCDKALRIDELLSTPHRIESLEAEGGHPAIVASPQALERSEASATAVPTVIEALRARFDCVVVNTAPAWDDLHMEVLALSNSVLFVLDQRPTGIRLCRHVLDLCARCSVPTQSFVFALNRCGRGALFSSIDVSCALSGAKSVEVLDGGKAVEEILGCGQPLDLASSRNALWMSVRKGILPLIGGPESGFKPVPRTKKRLRAFIPRNREAACL